MDEGRSSQRLVRGVLLLQSPSEWTDDTEDGLSPPDRPGPGDLALRPLVRPLPFEDFAPPCEKQSSVRPSAAGMLARLAALDGGRSSDWSSYLPIKAFLMMASRPMEFPGASGGGWLRTLTGPAVVDAGMLKISVPGWPALKSPSFPTTILFLISCFWYLTMSDVLSVILLKKAGCCVTLGGEREPVPCSPCSVGYEAAPCTSGSELAAAGDTGSMPSLDTLVGDVLDCGGDLSRLRSPQRPS